MSQNISHDKALETEFPLVEPLQIDLSAVDVFARLAHLPHAIYFDSASLDGTVGRYSFIAVDPFVWITRPADGTDALGELSVLAEPYRASTRSDLPPFQGGVAGLFGYELAQSLETIPSAQLDDLPLPALAVGLYDVVLAFDHSQEKSWIVSQGFPEIELQARRERAESRAAQIRQWIASPPSSPKCNSLPPIPRSDLTEQFECGVDGVTSSFSAANYYNMVASGVEYIRAGDIFQVNLAQRLLCPARCDSVELYLALREQNPAPYSGYLDLGDWQVCSTSPECFLTLRGDQVETRPIKGTRGRSPQPEADLFAGDELQLSEKDRAENVMIVDLLRNDLSRVCRADSVQVAQLCQLESYAYVKHLVSEVRGKLDQGKGPLDLLRCCFPGGSITGAPKIRAMEIITELEPTARGAYCGSLAYIGFDGQMDSSILIRTLTAGRGWWQLPVGGGIVAQSDPGEEYRETWHKARGMLAAMF